MDNLEKKEILSPWDGDIVAALDGFPVRGIEDYQAMIMKYGAAEIRELRYQLKIEREIVKKLRKHNQKLFNQL